MKITESKTILGLTLSALVAGSCLSSRAEFPRATYSLTLDGDLVTTSTFLGGQAPTFYEGYYTGLIKDSDYTTVRDSATNKALVGSDSAQPWGNGVDVLGAGGWSVLVVARGSEIANGVYFDVGWAAWDLGSDKCTGLSLIRNAKDEVALVRRAANTAPQEIMSVRVVDDTTRFHAYLVTCRPGTDGASEFALYVDGVKFSRASIPCPISREGFQLCGVYGGSVAAGLSTGSSFAIDEIGIWQTELTAAEAAEVCAHYPEWPSLAQHAASLAADANYSDLVWTPVLDDPSSAYGRLTAAAGKKLTFDVSASLYRLAVVSDSDFALTMGANGSIADVETFSLAEVAGKVYLDETTFPLLDKLTFTSESVVRVASEATVQVPAEAGIFGWLNKGQTLEIAAPLTFPILWGAQRLGLGNAAGVQNIVFDTGTTIDADQLRLGSQDSASVHVVQRDGSVQLGNASTAFWISERSLSNSSYTLLGGTLAVPNGYAHLGIGDHDITCGNAALTIGGGTEAAEMSAYCIQSFDWVDGNQVVTLRENGTLTLGAGGINMASAGGCLALEGGMLYAPVSARVFAAGGILVANTVEINVAEGATLVLETGLAGDGTITKTGAGTLVLASENPAFTGVIDVQAGVLALTDPADMGTGKMSFASSAALQLFVTSYRLIKGGSIKLDMGTVQPLFAVIGPDGRTALVENVDYRMTLNGTVRTVAFEPRLDKRAAWFDYTFTLDNLAAHQASGRMVANDGFAGASECLTLESAWTGENAYDKVNGQLLLQSVPCRDMTGAFAWPSSWTVALACQMPAVSDVCLLGIGSTYAATAKFLALATGSTTEKVRLVYGTGYTTAETLLELTLPSAETGTKRLFILSCDGTTCTVSYGSNQSNNIHVLGSCTLPFVDFGSGFQVGSLHGNVAGTGLRRADDVVEAAACKVRAVRIYDRPLDEQDMKRLRVELLGRFGTLLYVR